MEKALSEMTLEELWALFPIFLTEHKACWSAWYAEEAKRVTALFPNMTCHINHVGSTAINGIWAKPIIDILLEIPSNVSMASIKQTLLAHGYTCMSEDEKRASFNLGYTSKV